MSAVLPPSARRFDARRLYTALILIPLLYAIIRYLPPVGFFLLVAVASSLALIEFYRLHFRETSEAMTIAVGVALSVVFLTTFQWPGRLSLGAVSVTVVTVVLLYQLGAFRDVSRSLTDVSILTFGILYISATLGHLLLMRSLPDGVALTFFVMLVTWAADTGAYYTGVTVGHTPLARIVSPRKTVEGLVGGCLVAVAAAVLAQLSFVPSLTVLDAVLLGILLTLAGLFGDLSESMFKRSAGTKDSGSLIPGHGGMLDRVDSLLFTAPSFYYYVTLVKH